MLLHEQCVGLRFVEGDVVNAVSDLGLGIRNILRAQTLVDRLPGFSAIIGAESARGGDGDVDALGVRGVEQNTVQTHAARARLPLRPGAVAAKSGEFFPGSPAIFREEQRRVFYSGINVIAFGERRLQVPDPLELPRMLRAVVPLVRSERLAVGAFGVVGELIALPLRETFRAFLRLAAGDFPALAAVIRALNDLPEPSAGLRGVDAVRICG